MKNKINILLSCLLAVLLFSCTKKEAPLTPSDEEQGYKVPQGNNDYDATIVNFYKKYGSYLLYEFTDKDVYWTPSGWRNSTQSLTVIGLWSTGLEVVKANPAYIKKQLVLLDSAWFRFYSDKFLDEYLPVKIMLCSKVDSVFSTLVGFNPTTYNKTPKSVAAYYNYDNISVNNANATIDNMTAADKKIYLAKVNLVFAESIIARGLAKASAPFASIANYAGIINTTALRYAQGIINHTNSTPDGDWGSYMLAMVSTSEVNLNVSTANTDATFRGILNATKDANGKIRSRYNLIRNYYITNYGVDLQAIGNLAN